MDLRIYKDKKGERRKNSKDRLMKMYRNSSDGDSYPFCFLKFVRPKKKRVNKLRFLS